MMLDQKVIDGLIRTMLDGGADFCDVYCEKSAYNGVTADDRKINTSRSIQSGVGLRAVKNFNTYYTVCQDATPENLAAAAGYLAAGLSVVSDTPRSPVILTFGREVSPLSGSKKDPEQVEITDKTELIRSAQETAWGYSDKIKQVTARYSDFYRDVQIGSSETGEISRQRLGLVEFMITVYAGDGSERQMGWA
ncbi:MAG: hypothetical protein KAT85_02875, partial [candidate division Zixibacteria bacterium]|nr:hypothetical protein [candidate division Zixibacteria bacterium]